MRRVVILAALAILGPAVGSAPGQLFDLVDLDRLNGKLAGRVVDHTQNHGCDRRIISPILGRPRDLYVYLPPGYDPRVAYPLIVYLHPADVDEHNLLDPRVLKQVDRMMALGVIPPAVIAAPDGTYSGRNRITSTHSLWVNGLGGRFEDHIVFEVVPFVQQNYSIRPEREAHGLLGVSAGGFGAMAIALKHRDQFGSVATLAGPLNMLYGNVQGRYGAPFDPATYREQTEYDSRAIIARYYLGALKRRVGDYLDPVYGNGPDVLDQIRSNNPANLIAATGLQPGELAIYLNFGGRDNYNFDDQARSFAWLAGLRGVAVTIEEIPNAHHDLFYMEKAEPMGFRYLGQHLLPPAPRGG